MKDFPPSEHRSPVHLALEKPLLNPLRANGWNLYRSPLEQHRALDSRQIGINFVIVTPQTPIKTLHELSDNARQIIPLMEANKSTRAFFSHLEKPIAYQPGVYIADGRIFLPSITLHHELGNYKVKEKPITLSASRRNRQLYDYLGATPPSMETPQSPFFTTTVLFAPSIEIANVYYQSIADQVAREGDLSGVKECVEQTKLPKTFLGKLSAKPLQSIHVGDL